MLVATWNVNSIRKRLPLVLDWLRETAPDILLLQETKTPDESFPRLELQGLGYRILSCGEKCYNGVAILSRLPMEATVWRLPGDDDDHQARYLEAHISGDIRVASLYLPNGNPSESKKFSSKLAWMTRLYDHALALLRTGDAVILGGDYNVCPSDDDVYAPDQWADNALCRLEVREAFQAILWLGYCDAFRVFNHMPDAYTFWSYQAGAWPCNRGLRIDHLLLSPQAADRLEASGIEKKQRGCVKASDHVPVWCRLRARG
ncbi:Exodeoxyribonuclease III [invertebrate metagenome]|uniref:Exodeoxyribonuclease III n=1 Tax=invertebrate metagenome TaxID=1711999 RepID=A0A484H7E7_9ZZZZ